MRIVKAFKGLEKELHDKHEISKLEAEQLAADVCDPKTSDADLVWKNLWTKPLYANTKVSIALSKIQELQPYMDEAWKYWGKSDKGFLIKKIAKGSASSSFNTETLEASKIKEKTRIALYRLFAIQSGSSALRARASKDDHPYCDLLGKPVAFILPLVQAEMGFGWGHITTLHFLTDLGLACKPDIHLVRSFRYLGLSSSISDTNKASFNEAIEINSKVYTLVRFLYGEVTPQKLRYIDKTLMDISRYKII